MGQGSGTNIVTTGTKRCPYCGEEINVTATKCRYCGEWLAKNVTKPSEQKVEEVQDKDMTASDVMDITASGLGCVWALVKMCIPVLLFVYAYNSKPDFSEHKKEVANEVVKCTKDEIKSTTNTFIPGLGILASNLIDGSINDDNVKNMFFRNNSLELKDSWFWNRGILYNSYNPEGTTVSFGICGFVIPLVEWEDFKLMEE